ncbi:protein of unknown function [Paramicrobacterium humi]|uniref:DUF4194 domain-containing protein n=1 Tax=Paramicrobacterium humi TaxID=640635 RepID=A0A1H4JQ79_9MICO|nr:DUF4194 domain-containing protein [Microbacterium humi]SEB48474.1 protein of unknown function [Microbacterium humi]
MTTTDEHAVATAIIKLMQGVVYRETHEDVWRTLERNSSAVRDHFSEIGVGVIVDDTEGYAFVKTIEPDEGEEPLPRLVKRRSLTYHVSLLLLLLRKRMAEFEAGGGEGKLVMEREQIIEMLRVFLQETTNEARAIRQVDQTISQAVKLGFLHPLSSARTRASNRTPAWEVRRILKAYVDAEAMAGFSERLADYARNTDGEGDDD